MAISYAVLTKNARLDQINTDIGTSGFLRIYDGTPPADADTALSGNTLLADLALSATAFGSATGGTMTAASISDDASADNTGTASFFRLVTSVGTAKVQGSVGTSGADLNLNSVAISSGANVAVSSMVITAGN